MLNAGSHNKYQRLQCWVKLEVTFIAMFFNDFYVFNRLMLEVLLLDSFIFWQSLCLNVRIKGMLLC